MFGESYERTIRVDKSFDTCAFCDFSVYAVVLRLVFFKKSTLSFCKIIFKRHSKKIYEALAETNEVTPMILQELIDKIEVHAVEGTGLNRTQEVIIHYKFIGELDMPENFDKIKVNTRKGVEVEYMTSTKTA